MRYPLLVSLPLALGALLPSSPVYALQASPPPSRPAVGNPPAARPSHWMDAASTWADIQAQVRDLNSLVKEKRLDEIHPVAFEIRDLVRTLPEKSQALPPAARKKLEAQVRIVDRLAEQLDKYGDAQDAAGTARQQKALLGTLGTIKSLYPASALTPRATAPAVSKERELYLTPGGLYTEADIRANGNQLPAQKFRGVKVSHDLKPNVGDRICPITLTKANPGYTWTVGGKEYQFCCPPCVEEFVRKAKTDPSGLKSPEEYIKKP